MNSCWLTLVHTLALLRTWPSTLSYGVYSFLMHTHIQRTCTHQLCMWQTIRLSDDGTNYYTNTLTHKHCHMHMHSIQFNLLYLHLCTKLAKHTHHCITHTQDTRNTHTDTQMHNRHTNADTQTHTHTWHTQTQTYSDTQTHTDGHRLTHMDTKTHHTYGKTHTHAHTHCHTHA